MPRGDERPTLQRCDTRMGFHHGRCLLLEQISVLYDPERMMLSEEPGMVVCVAPLVEFSWQRQEEKA